MIASIGSQEGLLKSGILDLSNAVKILVTFVSVLISGIGDRIESLVWEEVKVRETSKFIHQST